MKRFVWKSCLSLLLTFPCIAKYSPFLHQNLFLMHVLHLWRKHIHPSNCNSQPDILNLFNRCILLGHWPLLPIRATLLCIVYGGRFFNEDFMTPLADLHGSKQKMAHSSGQNIHFLCRKVLSSIASISTIKDLGKNPE